MRKRLAIVAIAIVSISGFAASTASACAPDPVVCPFAYTFHQPGLPCYFVFTY